MRKRILLTVAAVLVATAVTGFVYAESRLDLEAELIFTGATDDRVALKITNWSRKKVTIAEEGFYIDEVGSAGSWNCRTEEAVTLGPWQSRQLDFDIEKSVTHGSNSILVFFFEHDGTSYLAKCGENLGLEYFNQHN